MPLSAAPRNRILFLSIVSFLLFLPFSGKPLHMDSPVTVYVATQLLINPLNPPAGEYGPLLSPWNHTQLPETSAFHATPHPPLCSWWAALFIRLFGVNEFALNWSFFPFYLGSVLFFFGLCARTGIRSRFTAALLFAVSPALLVNAQNVMYDVPLAMFTIGCFYFMFKGDTGRNAILAGLFAGCACLTKFTAGTLIIAGVLYFISRRQWRNLLCFALPAAGCNLLWLLHNLYYFHGWQLTNSGHAVYLIGDIRYRFERMIAFIGAGYLVPLFPLYIWWKSRRFRRFGILIGAGAFVWSLLLVFRLQYSFTSALVYWVCAFAGGVLLAQLPLFARTGQQAGPTKPGTAGPQKCRHGIAAGLFAPCSPGTILCIHAALQIIGGLFLTLYAVRYSLTFIFIFIIISVKSVEVYLSPALQKRFWLAAIPLSLLLSLSLSLSDYDVVNAEKRVAFDLRARFPDQTIFFKGRLGYLYYLHRIHAKSLLPLEATPAAGDLMIDNCLSHDDDDVIAACGDRLQPIDSLTYPIFPLRTIGGRAGFYGYERLPYAWITQPPGITFKIFRVMR